jgi:hypothetical protein
MALAVFAAVMALSACVATPRPGGAQSPSRPLAAPAAAGEHEVTQVVRGAFGSREITFNCAVAVKGGVMTVVGLNPLGVRLFTLRYDGKDMHVEKAPGVPDAITPDRLLADLQLVYWPLRPLQETLQAAGFELTAPTPGSRRLRRGGRLVAEVHYAGDDAWSGRAWLVNLEFGYSLQIDSQP